MKQNDENDENDGFQLLSHPDVIEMTELKGSEIRLSLSEILEKSTDDLLIIRRMVEEELERRIQFKLDLI